MVIVLLVRFQGIGTQIYLSALSRFIQKVCLSMCKVIQSGLNYCSLKIKYCFIKSDRVLALALNLTNDLIA